MLMASSAPVNPALDFLTEALEYLSQSEVPAHLAPEMEATLARARAAVAAGDHVGIQQASSDLSGLQLLLAGEVPSGSAQTVVGEATVVLPLAGLIDLDAERARLARDRAKLADEAAKIARKLDNADFVARAKEEVVEENRDRLATAEAEMGRLDAALRRIA